MQKACIVIPCFNEESRLELHLFDEFLRSQPDIDFLFVNDGSSDGTLGLLKNFKIKHPQRVELLELTLNAGKAEAVRIGVLAVCNLNRYNYVGFWDADLATPLSEILHFLEVINENSIAIGSRLKRLGAIIERKRLRHLLGRIFSTFSSIILKMPVYDTQCGAKLFKTDQAFLFEQKFITRWLFDIELLARYRNKHGITKAMADVIEIPVNVWMEKGGSKLRLSHMLKVPVELWKIYKTYN